MPHLVPPGFGNIVPHRFIDANKTDTTVFVQDDESTGLEGRESSMVTQDIVESRGN